MIYMTASARWLLDNVTSLVYVMTKAPQKAIFTPVHALQEDAVAGDKLSRDQDVLHVRQARSHIGARPYGLTHSMQCSKCIMKSDNGHIERDEM